jgi:hypothetical protein
MRFTAQIMLKQWENHDRAALSHHLGNTALHVVEAGNQRDDRGLDGAGPFARLHGEGNIFQDPVARLAVEPDVV